MCGFTPAAGTRVTKLQLLNAMIVFCLNEIWNIKTENDEIMILNARFILNFNLFIFKKSFYSFTNKLK